MKMQNAIAIANVGILALSVITYTSPFRVVPLISKSPFPVSFNSKVPTFPERHACRTRIIVKTVWWVTFLWVIYNIEFKLDCGFARAG